MSDPKPKKVWDNIQVVGEVLKSERTKIQVEVVARDGVKYINFREWYMKKTDKEWKPNGLAGFATPIAFPIDGKVAAPTHELYHLIRKAVEVSKDFALHDPENEVWYTPKPKVKK